MEQASGVQRRVGDRGMAEQEWGSGNRAGAMQETALHWGGGAGIPACQSLRLQVEGQWAMGMAEGRRSEAQPGSGRRGHGGGL